MNNYIIYFILLERFLLSHAALHRMMLSLHIPCLKYIFCHLSLEESRVTNHFYRLKHGEQWWFVQSRTRLDLKSAIHRPFYFKAHCPVPAKNTVCSLRFVRAALYWQASVSSKKGIVLVLLCPRKKTWEIFRSLSVCPEKKIWDIFWSFSIGT